MGPVPHKHLPMRWVGYNHDDLMMTLAWNETLTMQHISEVVVGLSTRALRDRVCLEQSAPLVHLLTREWARPKEHAKRGEMKHTNLLAARRKHWNQGGCFNIKYQQHRNSHYEDKTFTRPFYLYNSYLGQVTKARLSCYLVLLSNDSKTR